MKEMVVFDLLAAEFELVTAEPFPKRLGTKGNQGGFPTRPNPSRRRCLAGLPL